MDPMGYGSFSLAVPWSSPFVMLPWIERNVALALQDRNW